MIDLLGAEVDPKTLPVSDMQQWNDTPDANWP